MINLRFALLAPMACWCVIVHAQRKEWAIAKEQNSIPAVESFMDQNPGSKLMAEATSWRDSLYVRALANGATLELFQAYLARPHNAATEANMRQAHAAAIYERSAAEGTRDALDRFKRTFPGQMLNRLKEDGCRLEAERIMGTAREDSIRAFAKRTECTGTVAMDRIAHAIEGFDSVAVTTVLANDTLSSVFWFVMSHREISPARFAQVDDHFKKLLAKASAIDAHTLFTRVDSMISPFVFAEDVIHLLDSSAANPTTVAQATKGLMNTSGVTRSNGSRATNFMTVSMDPPVQVRYDTDYTCKDRSGRFPKTCMEAQWRNNHLTILDIIARMKVPNALTGDLGDGERQIRVLPCMVRNEQWTVQLRVFYTDAAEVYARFEGKWYSIQ